ncbi:hypothetical protein HDU84_006337 [Entophlyctis sp. JEL0112]|nr:hypothetical protein HDU84_006337 [Entophlyctis sp. JEL0112]
MEAMSVFRTDGSSTNASAIDGSYISTKPMLQPSNNGALKAWTGVETAMSSPSRENHPSTPFKISPDVTSALANATMSKNVRVPANSQSEEDFGAAKKLSLPVQPLFLGSKFSDIQELAQPIGGRKDTRNYVVQEATKKKYAHGMRARGMMKGEHVGVQVVRHVDEEHLFAWREQILQWFRMNSFEEVKAAIAADAFLTSAKLEDNLIRLTLTTYGDDVRRSLKVLTNFAHWHAENLNDPAARVSILHVHAFFLTKMYYGLPHLVARDGRFLAFRSLNADRIGGIPKQFSAFMAMFLFYRAQLPAMDLRWVDLSNVENFKVMNLRLTLYKELNDVAASVPVVPTSALIFHNCNPYFVASLRAVQRQFPEFPQILFTKGQELFQYVDPSMLPQEFGGTITPEQMDADIEDQIKRMYALEGLRYSPIDVKAINWRTYRVPGPVYESRPYSSISSQPIDFDAIDAHLRAMGISDDHEMDLDEGDNSKSNKSNTKRIH